MEDEIPPSVPADPPPLPVVTTIAELRRRARRRWLVTLPSGMVFKCLRPDMAQLIAEGIVDADAFVRQQLTGDDGDTKRQYALLSVSAKAAAPYIALEPRVVAGAATDDALSVDELEGPDRLAMFLWAGGWTTTNVNAVPIDE